MGNFYCNTLLRGARQDEVAEELRRLKRTAFVSAEINGYVLVCDEGCDSQDDKQIVNLGTTLSRRFAGPVFSVMNHDDDILFYWLFGKGQLVDRYDSTPGYFEGDRRGPEGGNAEILCQALMLTADRGAVEKILRAKSGSDGDSLCAIERHGALATALHLPQESVGSGYGYIEAGDEFGTANASSMIRITQSG